MTANNIDHKQYCKGCEKNVFLSSFIVNGKSYKTCNTCCVQNKAVYQRKIQAKQQAKKLNKDTGLNENMEFEFDDFDDFDDFNDFIAQIFNTFENSMEFENQENREFKFSCAINTSKLKGNFKEQADYIVKIISDVDEYTWMYVLFFKLFYYLINKIFNF